MQIISGKKPAPRRVLIHGDQGIGKTGFLANSPDPIIIPTEAGQDDYDVDRFPLCKTLSDVLGCINWLASSENNHKYKTCGIDSLSAWERLACKEIAKAASKPTVEEIAYGKGIAAVGEKCGELLDALESLRQSKRMNIVLIAHTYVDTEKLADGGEFTRYEPQLRDKHVKPRIVQWCDEIIFARIPVNLGPAGDKAQPARGYKERRMYLDDKPWCVCKKHLAELPDEMDLDAKAYWNAVREIYQGYSKKAEVA